MKYDVTYSCGHEGMIECFGERSKRERALWSAEHGLCPECEAKERQAMLELAVNEANEAGLPELFGTEKQVIWAIKLRKYVKTAFDDYLKRFDLEYPRKRLNADTATQETLNAAVCARRKLLVDCMDYLLKNKNSASWWIDARYNCEYMGRWIQEQAAAIEPLLAAQETERKEADDPDAILAKKEATLAPENVLKPSIAEVIIKCNEDDSEQGTICVRYEKDDDFRTLVKALHYTWDRNAVLWQRSIGAMRGPLTDRAAELVNSLLRAGFTVRCFDDKVLQMATDASFMAERDNWIGATDDGRLCIFCRGDELYRRACTIKGARWDTNWKALVAPMNSLLDIEEFARLMDFAFTKKAKSMIESYKEELESAKVVKPEEPAIVKQKDGLSDILVSSKAVIDDLRDD
ncbi:MAG: hypothetical protein RRZ24_11370 [Clostridia bacterium]